MKELGRVPVRNMRDTADKEISYQVNWTEFKKRMQTELFGGTDVCTLALYQKLNDIVDWPC